MTREYFKNNVMMAVEVECENGGRYWREVKGSKLTEYCNRTQDCGDFISDIDYCTKQEDEWCRKVLNTASLNWSKNYEWCKKMGFTSLNEVIYWIIDNKKVS